jgi:hypothetical protein
MPVTAANSIAMVARNKIHSHPKDVLYIVWSTVPVAVVLSPMLAGTLAKALDGFLRSIVPDKAAG